MLIIGETRNNQHFSLWSSLSIIFPNLCYIGWWLADNYFDVGALFILSLFKLKSKHSSLVCTISLKSMLKVEQLRNCICSRSGIHRYKPTVLLSATRWCLHTDKNMQSGGVHFVFQRWWLTDKLNHVKWSISDLFWFLNMSASYDSTQEKVSRVYNFKASWINEIHMRWWKVEIHSSGYIKLCLLYVISLGLENIYFSLLSYALYLEGMS